MTLETLISEAEKPDPYKLKVSLFKPSSYLKFLKAEMHPPKFGADDVKALLAERGYTLFHDKKNLEIYCRKGDRGVEDDFVIVRTYNRSDIANLSQGKFRDYEEVKCLLGAQRAHHSKDRWFFTIGAFAGLAIGAGLLMPQINETLYSVQTYLQGIVNNGAIDELITGVRWLADASVIFASSGTGSVLALELHDKLDKKKRVFELKHEVNSNTGDVVRYLIHESHAQAS